MPGIAESLHYTCGSPHLHVLKVPDYASVEEENAEEGHESGEGDVEVSSKVNDSRKGHKLLYSWRELELET